jgi:hypothetical protein
MKDWFGRCIGIGEYGLWGNIKYFGTIILIVIIETMILRAISVCFRLL